MRRVLLIACALAGACGRGAAPDRAEPAHLRVGPGVALAPVSARDGLLPVQLLDRVEGTCGWQAFEHVELLDVATGQARWSTAAWTALVAELPDGDLVVTNGAPRATEKLAAAVLRRRDGSLRALCSTALPANDVAISWTRHDRRDDVIAGMVFQLFAPSGTPMEHHGVRTTVVFHTDGDGCELVEGGVPASRTLPMAGLTLDQQVGDVRVVVRGAALVGERDGHELWRREVGAAAEGPCAIP